MSIYLHFVPFSGYVHGLFLMYQLTETHMTMKAKKHNPTVPMHVHQPLPRFHKAIVIDDNEMENQITETIMRACYVAKEIKLESNPHAAIHNLHNIQRLSEVPELIFVNLHMKSLEKLDFIAEFEGMSDFVKNKCKIIVISNRNDLEEKQRVLMNSSVVRYLVKPLDAFQLREFINI